MITELCVYTQTQTHAYTQALPLPLEIHTEELESKLCLEFALKYSNSNQRRWRGQ